jgi:hypothetical protein
VVVVKVPRSTAGRAGKCDTPPPPGEELTEEASVGELQVKRGAMLCLITR